MIQGRMATEPSEIVERSKAAGLSITELASQTGLEESTIYRWASGDTAKRGPTKKAWDDVIAVIEKAESKAA